jgi:hypothetical protein
MMKKTKEESKWRMKKLTAQPEQKRHSYASKGCMRNEGERVGV